MANSKLENSVNKQQNSFIDTSNTRALVKYFQNSEFKFMQVDNFGLSLDDAGELGKGKSVLLRDLFVPPHLSDRHLAPEQVISADSDSEPIWQNIVNILKDHPQCFILGDPGTGKTTLTHWLILAFSYSGMNATKAALGGLVPFPLILRELALNDINTFDELWRVFTDRNQDVMHAFTEYKESYDVIKALFRNGQALILLDGLDEITNEQTRKNLGNAVLDGMRKYPKCKFLISSRVVGFDQRGLFGFDPVKTDINKISAITIKKEEINDSSVSTIEDIKFRLYRQNSTPLPIFYLAPFTYSQAQQFVSNWYKLYKPNNDGNHDHRVAELLIRIKKNDGLGRLSRTPVLLNMICFIHARRGRLPDGRAELYQRIEETYLVALDTARGITAGGEHFFNFDYADRSDWLSEIAYNMQSSRSHNDREADILISESRVRQILNDKLVGLEVPKEDLECEINFLLRQFAERSGLFLPRGKGNNNEERYGFSHLSFLEYFAAKALKPKLDLAEIDWKSLIVNTNLTWWQETFILFFEQIENAKLADLYLSKLFPEKSVFTKSTKTTKVNAQSLLASIVTDSGVKLTNFTREKVIKKLWNSFKVLSLSDPFITNELIQRLWQNQYNSLDIGSEVLNSIKSLSLSMTEITDFSLVYELTQLQNLFLDNTEFSDITKLSKLDDLQILSLDQTHVTNLNGLEHLTKLYYLSLEYNQIHNISDLPKLADLHQLYLSNTQISEISTIARLTKLVRLHIENTEISDISSLAGLTFLEYLRIGDTKVVDISPLSSLNKLKVLNLMNTKVKNISPLGKLNNLTLLSLSNTQISDLSPLKRLKRLTSLNLSRTNIEEISPLAELTQLEDLNLTNTLVANINELGKLVKMESLQLQGTKVKDISTITKFSKLKRLRLDNTKVTDISGLVGLVELKSLHLNNTVISDISALAGLINLESLTLNNTLVSDISALAGLTKLENLIIHNTQVTDISSLAGLKSLRYVNLSNTPVEDVSALSGIPNLVFFTNNDFTL